MTPRNKNIAIIILSLLLVIAIGVSGYYINKSRQLDSINTFLNDSVVTYKNKYGQEIAQKSVLLGDIDALNTLLSKQIDSTRELSKLVDKFRDIDYAGKVITETVVDSILIPYEVPVDTDFERSFKINDEYFELAGLSSQDGILVETLYIPNTLSFVSGEKKVGFFKTKRVIEVNNSNPYVKTIGIDSYTNTERIKRIGVGPYVGYDIFNSTISGGISIHYSLIRF